MQLPLALLERPIQGLRLRGTTLGEQLGGRPAVLVFLRHFGCLFCREMVRDVRREAEANPDYPPVIFFFQGTVAQGAEFFGKFYPEAVAVEDSTLTFYRAFGLKGGSAGQLLGLRAVGAALRALAKGNFVGRWVGDVTVMPGVFAVAADGRVIWSYAAAHAGDHPDFALLPAKINPGR
ncbi:MAG TPA: SelL-related redox protein [Rariglobus sp.]|jgi:hypothetical protein|nr:SelL-related redox protein [Rariglobus sp.]